MTPAYWDGALRPGDEVLPLLRRRAARRPRHGRRRRPRRRGRPGPRRRPERHGVQPRARPRRRADDDATARSRTPPRPGRASSTRTTRACRTPSRAPASSTCSSATGKWAPFNADETTSTTGQELAPARIILRSTEARHTAGLGRFMRESPAHIRNPEGSDGRQRLPRHRGDRRQQRVVGGGGPQRGRDGGEDRPRPARRRGRPRGRDDRERRRSAPSACASRSRSSTTRATDPRNSRSAAVALEALAVLEPARWAHYAGHGGVTSRPSPSSEPLTPIARRRSSGCVPPPGGPAGLRRARGAPGGGLRGALVHGARAADRGRDFASAAAEADVRQARGGG